MAFEEIELREAVTRLEISHGEFHWSGSFQDVAVLISQLQLALRHPGNRGLPAKQTMLILEKWMATMGKEEPVFLEWWKEIKSSWPDMLL